MKRYIRIVPCVSGGKTLWMVETKASTLYRRWTYQATCDTKEQATLLAAHLAQPFTIYKIKG